MNLQAIVRTKQQWQSAADLMPQLICLVDGKGHVIQINRTLEWWGLGPVTSAKGKELHALLHPDCADPGCYFRQFWQNSIAAWLDGRNVEHEAFDPVRERHFFIRMQPIGGRHPGLARNKDDLHAVVVLDDISLVKQAEGGMRQRYEELAQQVAHESEQRALSEEMQARLLTILEKTTDYVAMADTSGAMLYLNPAGRRMLGLEQGADISQLHLCEHEDNDFHKYIMDIAIPAAIKNGIWSGEMRLRDNAGHDIYTSQVIIAHRSADGEVDCLSTIRRDISGRILTEQALRESQKELKRLSKALVTIQEDERRRIALDLHDGLGQSLSLIKLAVKNTIVQLSAGETDASLRMLDQVVQHLGEALSDVRRVASELRPSILDDLGILPTLSWFFREFEAMCGHIKVEKAITITEEDVPEPIKITLYRILQEATSNIVKHAQADHMRVHLYRIDHELHLLVEDDGRGFNTCCLRCTHDENQGLGLASMQERASLSGGNLILESSPGVGTRIQVSWPIQ